MSDLIIGTYTTMLMAVVALSQDTAWLYTDGGLTLLALAAGFVVLSLLENNWALGRLTSSWVSRWVGDRSYAIYL